MFLRIGFFELDKSIDIVVFMLQDIKELIEDVGELDYQMPYVSSILPLILIGFVFVLQLYPLILFLVWFASSFLGICVQNVFWVCIPCIWVLQNCGEEQSWDWRTPVLVSILVRKLLFIIHYVSHKGLSWLILKRCLVFMSISIVWL